MASSKVITTCLLLASPSCIWLLWRLITFSKRKDGRSRALSMDCESQDRQADCLLTRCSLQGQRSVSAAQALDL